MNGLLAGARALRFRTWLSCCALASLTACTEPQQISASGSGAYEVSLAAWSDGLAAAWYDTRDGNAEIYARALDLNGNATGPEWRITTTAAQSYEADIAPLTGAFAIAWYEKSSDDAVHAQLGVWERDGTPRWTIPIAAGGGYSRNPVVRSFNDALFCAWIETDSAGREYVWAAWWTIDGQPQSAPARLGAVGDTTWNLNAAISASGEAWVVFDARAGTRAEELFLAKLDGEHGSLARLSADDGVRSKYPDLALEGERAAITWFDERDGNNEVYMAAGPVADLAQSIDKHARRITITPGASIGAYVAWNAGQIGLAWSEDSGDNYEVLFQPFDATASPLAAARWLTETRANSMIPAIKPCGDGFVLAWDEVTPGEGGDAHDPSTRAEILFAIVR